MPAPTLESFAETVYASLSPMAQDDASNGYALANFVDALGAMFQILDDYSRDQGDAPGWSQLLDITRTPTEALPWLGQFVGVRVNDALNDSDQRQQVQSVNGWSRGTVSAFKNAPLPWLTGNKTVILRERDGDPYFITVVTFTNETLDATKILAALLAQKPAGLVLTYSVLTGQDYELLFEHKASYQAVFTAYATYNDLLNDQSNVIIPGQPVDTAHGVDSATVKVLITVTDTNAVTIESTVITQPGSASSYGIGNYGSGIYGS